MKKKFFIKFIFFTSFIILSFVILTLPCYAASSVDSFNNFKYNQIQVGFSNESNQGTANSYANGDEVGVYYSDYSSKLQNGVTRFYNKHYLSASILTDSVKPNNFSLSTNSKSLQHDPYISINPAFAGTYFCFNIRTVARFYSSEDSNGTVYGTDFTSLKVWNIPEIMNGYFYISSDGEKYHFSKIDTVTEKLVTPSIIEFNYTYYFEVPEGGLDIYGFFFNYPFTVGLGTVTDSINCALNFYVSNFVLDTNFVSLDLTNYRNFKDKINILNIEADKIFANAINQTNLIHPDTIFSNTNFLHSTAYFANIFDNYIINRDWLFTILSYSFWLGLFGYVLGLVSRIAQKFKE